MHREDGREASTLECVCVWMKKGDWEGLTPWASSPMLALHGLVHTAFGIRGDMSRDTGV